MRKLSLILLAALAALSLAACGGDTPDTPDTTAAPAETTAPAAPSLTLDGQYTIVRADTSGKVATAAGVALYEALESKPALGTDFVKRDETPPADNLEILLGATNRPASIELCAGLGLYDYKIAVVGQQLVVAAGSEDALAGAVAHLIRSGALEGGKIAADYSYAFDGADNRDEYIADPSRFIPSWTLDFDVPAWLTDYSEKQAAWADTDGRMMTAIHRADWKNYPENSIEAIISCIHAGADSLELDIGLTKDGVVVLLHDTTLKRTTDWSEKNGKNGLPTSNNLADWTLAELRQLRLKTNDGVQTDYLIPTFEEVLTVCKDRIWVRLDKLSVFDWARDIDPLIAKTGAYDTCIYNREYTLAKHRDYLRTAADHGRTALSYQTFANGNDWPALLTALRNYGVEPIAWWNGYDKKNSTASLKAQTAALNSIRGNVRIYVDAQSLGGAVETPAVWDELYAAGVNFILVDDVIAVQKYVAAEYSATK